MRIYNIEIRWKCDFLRSYRIRLFRNDQKVTMYFGNDVSRIASDYGLLYPGSPLCAHNDEVYFFLGYGVANTIDQVAILLKCDEIVLNVRGNGGYPFEQFRELFLYRGIQTLCWHSK